MSLAVVPISAVAELLVRLGPGKCLGIDELSSKLFIRRRLVEEALRRLSEAADPGVIELGGDCVSIRDVLGVAIAAVRLGVPESVVARGLSWRMFEDYAARALREAGYRVYHGLRVAGRGGLELAVLGLGGSIGVAVDCKHWSPRSTVPSRLRDAARRHVERLGRLEQYWDRLGLPSGCWKIVPALLVLRERVPRLVEGVAVVPVSRLRGFIEELPVLAEADEIGARRICSRQKRLF